jgi:hypothetical protein
MAVYRTLVQRIIARGRLATYKKALGQHLLPLVEIVAEDLASLGAGGVTRFAHY